MADRFELSYVYARICGSISGAYLGRKAVDLARSARVAEVWQTLFKEPAPPLPEAAVVAAAERREIAESLSGFRYFAAKLRMNEPFFDALRRKAEFARVKRILQAVRDGQAAAGTLPASDDPELAPSFDESAFPDIKLMFAAGRFSWIDETALDDLPATENKLDIQYYTELWEEARRLPASKAGAVVRLIRDEIELQNVAWALRLKRYYGMNRESIVPRLVALRSVDVVSAALQALDFRFDQREDWRGWAWEKLVPEKQVEGSFVLDLLGLETMARRHLYLGVRRALHFYPFTYTPLYCFFKIKESETAAVIGVIEGIHLGVPFEEMASFAAGITGGSA
jgi:hypothetical protein